MSLYLYNIFSYKYRMSGILYVVCAHVILSDRGTFPQTKELLRLSIKEPFADFSMLRVAKHTLKSYMHYNT